MSSTLLSGTVIRSRVVMSTPEDSGLSSVVTDGVTIQGDGTAGDPLHVPDGVFDPAGSAAAVAEIKQDILVSGTNIKTINGVSVLGSGDMVITSSGASLVVTPFNLTGL